MFSFACLLLLATCMSGSRALDLLDPTSLVDELSQRSAGLERWKKPEFCGKLDCPPFSTKKRTDNYDVRKYDAGKWVVTNVTGTKFELAYTQGVAKLLKYFKAGNDQEETIDVTTPTLAELKLGKEGEAEKDFSFSLWLPEKYHKDTPQPSDADVRVVSFEAIKVFARTFSGFATEGTILRETRSLHDILEDEDRDYGSDVVWAAVYDPPQKLLRRHNEVHIPATAQKI